MVPKDLEEKLIELDKDKLRRQESVSWILRNKPHYVRETLLWFSLPDSEHLIKAFLIMEDVCDRRPELFFKYMHLFVERLPQLKYDSALRSCAKICKT